MPSRLDAAVLEVLRQLVLEDNDALLGEYRERLAERTGVTVCLAVICEVAHGTPGVSLRGPSGLDESGVTTKMARIHARAPRGQRAYGSIPLGSWQRLTVLGALACEGLITTMSIEASTSTAVLLAYLEQVLVPKLQQVKPDALLVMDNLSPHHATEVRDLLDQAGIGLLYLPRYSPEFNPIEPARAKMKEPLKAKAPRTLAALEAELTPALDTITAQDARGWIRHVGYALH